MPSTLSLQRRRFVFAAGLGSMLGLELPALAAPRPGPPAAAALPTPFLIEKADADAVSKARAGGATLSAASLRARGPAGLRVVGAGGKQSATSQRTMAGSVNPQTWGVVALLVKVNNSVNLSQFAVSFNKGAAGAMVGQPGYPNGHGPANAKVRDGEIWFSFDTQTDMPAIYALGESSGITFKTSQAQAEGGASDVQYGACIGGAKGQPTVIFTFDDLYIDQFTLALPPMAERGLRANVFVARDLVGQNATKMNEAQLDQLYRQHGWSMALDSSTDDSNTRLDDMAVALGRSGRIGINLNRDYVLSKGWRGAETALCYTGGLWNEALCAALEADGYQFARTTQPGAMHTRFGRTGAWMTFFGYGMGGKSLDELKGALDHAIARGQTIVFYAHHVQPDASASRSDVKLESVWLPLLDYAKQKIAAGQLVNLNLAEFLARDAGAQAPQL